MPLKNPKLIHNLNYKKRIRHYKKAKRKRKKMKQLSKRTMRRRKTMKISMM
jgi:hypothetical protein